jgi:hypothetical protein
VLGAVVGYLVAEEQPEFVAGQSADFFAKPPLRKGGVVGVNARASACRRFQISQHDCAAATINPT